MRLLFVLFICLLHDSPPPSYHHRPSKCFAASLSITDGFPYFVYRVEIVEDTKIPNAATIKVLKQDHTLGNMIRAYVLLQLYPYLLRLTKARRPQPTPSISASPLRGLQSPPPSPPLLPHQASNRRHHHPRLRPRTSLHEAHRHPRLPRDTIQTRVLIQGCPGRCGRCSGGWCWWVRRRLGRVRHGRGGGCVWWRCGRRAGTGMGFGEGLFGYLGGGWEFDTLFSFVFAV